MNLKSTAAALVLAGVASIGFAKDPHLARNLAATCANCHGTGGHSVGGMEPLAGESKETLLRKLMAFRSGEKPATIMHQIARGYTEEQLELVADHFSSQR